MTSSSTQAAGFCVAEQAFIPVVDASGNRKELSLADALVQAHEIRQIACGSPLETLAIYRLLLAVAMRTHPVADEHDWSALWELGRYDADEIAVYCGRWRNRLDLFSPDHPWMQDPAIRGAGLNTDSPARLRHDLASGNNQTLFDHSRDDLPTALEPAAAARALLAAQAFAVQGGQSRPFYLSDAPLVGGVRLLLLGGNLFETLVLNTIPPDRTGLSLGEDRPAWEADELPAPRKEGTVAEGPLDLLTWNSRSVLFSRSPDGLVTGCCVQQRLKLDSVACPDPWTPFRKSKEKGWLPVRVQPGRAVWRDSAALLAFAGDDERCALLAWAARLREMGILPDRPYRLLATGLCNRQAKVEAWRSESLPLPVPYLERPALATLVAAAMEDAEKAGKTLRRALGEVARELGVRRDANADAVTAFWSSLEPPFLSLLVALPDAAGSIDIEAAVSEWRGTVWSSAVRVFDTAADGIATNARAMRAVARGRVALLGRRGTQENPE